MRRNQRDAQNEYFRSDREHIQGDYPSYSPYFRTDEVNAVYRLIEQKECISIIGVGTVGKTHFINHLQRKSVFERYKADAQSDIKADDLLFVYIDSQALLINTDSPGGVTTDHGWAGFELLLDRLAQACARQNITVKLTDLYADITEENANARLFAFRRFEQAVARVLRDASPAPKHIIFAIDEFERFFRVMPASFFINLRSLRDQFRYEVLFFGLARTEMFNLAENDPLQQIKLQDAEGFFELFKYPVYLRAAQGGDLLELMRYVNARLRQGAHLSSTQLSQLDQVVGGHGGLLRTAMFKIDQFPGTDTVALTQSLLDEMTVRRECQILLGSCTPNEREILRLIGKQQNTNRLIQVAPQHIDQYNVAIRTLMEKGLLFYHIPQKNGGPVTHMFSVVPEVLRLYLFLEDWLRQNRPAYSPPANPRPNQPNIPPPPPPTIPL
jgi:hypothetical protein